MTERDLDGVTVCGLDENAPPELLAALGDIARAARDAFGEPGDPVTVIVEDGPCPDEECS